MSNFQTGPRPSRAQEILTIGREHWDHDSYDPIVRRVFRRALQCKTPELGGRIYASENEERRFNNTCKSMMACFSCGAWATTQWQRERSYALPDGRYLSITFTMPRALWPLFAANPRLCRKLAVIAAHVIINYARVRKGTDVGVIPVLQTFNGKLEFNPHVHALVRRAGANGQSSIFFDRDELRNSWQRLVIALLRGVLSLGHLKLTMPHDEVERLLREEEKRQWYRTHVKADEKEHFLSYGGRYLRRPPFTERRILDIADGSVRFWYLDKLTHRREVKRCPIEEFIDLWAQHIPARYRHAVRYFGWFAPRRWGQEAAAILIILGSQSRRRPKRLPWAIAVQELSGVNPIADHKGQSMRFVRHIAPVVT